MQHPSCCEYVIDVQVTWKNDAPLPAFELEKTKKDVWAWLDKKLPHKGSTDYIDYEKEILKLTMCREQGDKNVDSDRRWNMCVCNNYLQSFIYKFIRNIDKNTLFYLIHLVNHKFENNQLKRWDCHYVIETSFLTWDLKDQNIMMNVCMESVNKRTSSVFKDVLILLLGVQTVNPLFLKCLFHLLDLDIEYTKKTYEMNEICEDFGFNAFKSPLCVDFENYSKKNTHIKNRLDIVCNPLDTMKCCFRQNQNKMLRFSSKEYYMEWIEFKIMIEHFYSETKYWIARENVFQGCVLRFRTKNEIIGKINNIKDASERTKCFDVLLANGAIRVWEKKESDVEFYVLNVNFVLDNTWRYLEYLIIQLRTKKHTAQAEEYENECVICLGVKTHVLVPCGHFCLCHDCARDIVSKSKKCPLCVHTVDTTHRIFL